MIVNGKKVLCGRCGCNCACCEKSDPCRCFGCLNNPKNPKYKDFRKFVDELKSKEK